MSNKQKNFNRVQGHNSNLTR